MSTSNPLPEDCATVPGAAVRIMAQRSLPPTETPTLVEKPVPELPEVQAPYEDATLDTSPSKASAAFPTLRWAILGAAVATTVIGVGALLLL